MERHTENAEGKFWIDQDVCCICGACFEIAPTNIKGFEGDDLSYVFKQPDTLSEIEAVREAMRNCPVEAIIEDE